MSLDLPISSLLTSLTHLQSQSSHSHSPPFPLILPQLRKSHHKQSKEVSQIKPRSENKERISEAEQKRRESIANLTQNLEGEIRNPLKGIPRERLFEDVARFQREKGLPEDILPLLRKGALVAQDPAGFEDLEDIDEEEKEWLRKEVTHRWTHPWPLYYTIVLNSIAAAIQGWDQVSLFVLDFSFPSCTWFAGGQRNVLEREQFPPNDV